MVLTLAEEAVPSLEQVVKILHAVAKSPFSYVAFLVLVAGWCYYIFAVKRIETAAGGLKELSKEQVSGLKLLLKPMLAHISPKDRYRALRNYQLLIAFLGTLAFILILVTLVRPASGSPTTTSSGDKPGGHITPRGERTAQESEALEKLRASFADRLDRTTSQAVDHLEIFVGNVLTVQYVASQKHETGAPKHMRFSAEGWVDVTRQLHDYRDALARYEPNDAESVLLRRPPFI